MDGTRAHRTAAVALIALIGFGIAGCATSGTGSTSSVGSMAAAPAEPLDLSGDWTQTNSKSTDSYQAATITADTIEVNWVSDGGDTTSVYWAGSYDAPADAADSYEWSSNNDRSKTDSAILASGDDTKTFTYDQGVISYEVSALGTTTTVKLERK